MEIGLGWLGVVVGLAGFAAAYLSARADSAREESAAEPINPWPVALFTLAITLVFWAIAMRGRPPFSPGQSMAFGFLIGGLAGTAAVFVAAQLRGSTVRSRQMAVLCMCFLGLFTTSLVYVLFHGCPEWAMLGLAAGVLLTGIVGLALESASTLTGAFAVFSLTTTTAVIFALNHFDQPGQRVWWPVPILVAATVGLAAFVGIVVGAFVRSDDKPGRPVALSALVASVIVLGLDAIYAAKIVAHWQLLWVAAAGIGVAAIAAWIAMCAARTEDDASLTQAGAASAVLAVALVIVAFKLWAGLGMALGLLAAWAVVIPLLGLVGKEEGEAAPNAVRGLVLFVASVLLFRLFIEYYRTDLGTTDLRIHYTFIGAILGALMPRILATCQPKSPTGPWCRAAGIAFLGFVAAAAPLALVVIWGLKAAMGFVFGLTAALGLRYIESLGDMRQMRMEGLLALGAGLTSVAFVGPLLEVELTRVYRIAVLAGVVVIAIAWLLISGGLSRRAAE
jgi:hypothetical protein